MSYKYSNLDRNNLGWFGKDNTRASLVDINLKKGNIRGLKPFRVKFKYPISAFSGVNGSGKSTILALSACAYHGKPDGYIPPLRSQNYYTFRDFFIQSSNEVPFGGVEILYGFLHNNWNRMKDGLAFQKRKKRQGGRWNDYKTRVPRNVVYFGVQRVVPYFERSVHKSYRNRFKPGSIPDETKIKIADIASKIIGKNYSEFDSFEHSKYSLPNVVLSDSSYSGFNMGAGESAIFEILTCLFIAGEGTLIIIDEIELGLHEKAQSVFINELKKLCNEMKCQVICSTHSHAVLSNLPPEARFHIDNVGSQFNILEGVSADFACGNMGRIGASELDIFVEDKIGRSVLTYALNLELRKRSKVMAIGSSSAVARQLSSRNLEHVDNCIAFLDGDKKSDHAKTLKLIVDYTEASTEQQKSNVKTWAEERLFYLPGDVWPEKWIIESSVAVVRNSMSTENVVDGVDGLISNWGISSKEELLEMLLVAERAGKHCEFYELATLLGLDEESIKIELIRFAITNNSEITQSIHEGVIEILD